MTMDQNKSVVYQDVYHALIDAGINGGSTLSNYAQETGGNLAGVLTAVLKNNYDSSGNLYVNPGPYQA